jgi:hypothetical protein
MALPRIKRLASGLASHSVYLELPHFFLDVASSFGEEEISVSMVRYRHHRQASYHVLLSKISRQTILTIEPH